MPRPRKNPAPSGAKDPQTLVGDVLDEVKAVLRERGISVPLNVWIEAQQAAAALIPTNGNHTTNTNEEVQANG